MTIVLLKAGYNLTEAETISPPLRVDRTKARLALHKMRTGGKAAGT
jgi:hypothetical protein